jgi:hypothetical protein
VRAELAVAFDGAMYPVVGLQLSGNVLTPLDDEAAGQLGRPVWDARGLLDDLELRLGLPREVVSHGVRVQQWSKRLAQLVAESAGAPPYFAQAYREDPTGTAAQLLKLRDELVDAGWDGAPLTGAERLVTLSRLWALQDPPPPAGRADRLVSVEAELGRVTCAPYIALDLVESTELWPGRWRRVFARLAALGTRLGSAQPVWARPSGESDLARFQHALFGEAQDKSRPLAGDGSLILLRGATSSLLAEPTAALLAADVAPSTVLVRGADEGSLDAALARQGLARQGMRESSRWRPALQVLRLALSVAFVPRDPQRVLELVTLTSGPFAGRAGHLLAAALCDRPGLGNASWRKAKAELAEEQRARVELWLESPRLALAGAPREALLEVAERVLDWLTRRSLARPEPSWLSATMQAQAFVEALRMDPRAQLDRAAVEQLLQDLTEERATGAGATEEAGRLDHVESPERLLVSRERVVWWSFVGEQSLPRPSFRSQELEVLRRAGVPLLDPTLTLRGRFEGLQRAVHAASRQLVLVLPERVAGVRCTPHPLLDELVGRLLTREEGLSAVTLTVEELAQGSGIAARLPRMPLEPAAFLPLPPARRQWHIEPSLIRPRDAESASSLEKRIACPLSWTLHYQAGLRTASRGGIPSGPLFAGKLGHRLLEELHLAGQLSGSRDEVHRAAEAMFDTLLETEGAVLLAQGASDERNQLRSELVASAVELSMLLQEAQLTVAGVEEPVVGTIEGIPLTGNIDLLLRTQAGKEIVLDLKYGSKSYSDKLKEGKAIQLAVYAEARRQTSGAETMPPAGYFSLKNHRLMATDAAVHFGRPAQAGPSMQQTWARAQNTLAAIARTFASGRVPVTGVQATLDAGYLQVLGVETDQLAQHVELPAESACQYCQFGGVCGRNWEQTW